ncbi:HIT domain-containing protein [Brevirhabdus sp.]|uniref:HIT domain-containing protein n=1 Tax=Brevirhabdus sp. TaxID=2004514 RepID=UPI00405A289A
MTLADTRPGHDNKFHWLFLPRQRSTTALYDIIIEETQNFAVLPTKGSIVAGWVLVVPKFPTPRMADVPQSMFGELRELVNRTISKIESKFGATYTFEHGGLKGSPVSCGVDQAHLHIAPVDFNLLEAAQAETASEWMHAGTDRVPQNDCTDSEYWFVSSGEISAYKAIDCPRSQFFRKIIARETGNADRWDYRGNDFVENVSATLEAIGANG